MLNTTTSLELDYPIATRGRLVVWGLLSVYPFGGMTWQVLQYLAGLRLCGFDVWYVEETQANGIDPATLNYTDDLTVRVSYLKHHLAQIGLEDRWVLKPLHASERCFGSCNWQGLLELYRTADAVFNLCGSQEVLPHHNQISHRVYLETDPVVKQVKVANDNDATITELKQYQSLFSYGENLGSADCAIPVRQFKWVPTRAPVVCDWWNQESQPLSVRQVQNMRFTTITNWQFSSNDITWQGERWRWSKHHEFMRFQDAPGYSRNCKLELAVSGLRNIQTKSGMPLDVQSDFYKAGWLLSDADSIADPSKYREYIWGSDGEFTIAKEQYVRPLSGWFSDRSACYLAGGKPVVTQETGFSKFIPTNRGLFSFETLDDIESAFDAICQNPVMHATAARDIARQYFDAKVVATDMLKELNLM